MEGNSGRVRAVIYLVNTVAARPAQDGMARSGDNVFERAALPHLEAVFRLARRLSGNEADAEDLVQETYLKAQRAFDRFEMREYGIRPWLMRILHNTFLNRKAREKQSPRIAGGDMLEWVQDGDSGAAATMSPPALDYEQMDGEVKQALDGLAAEFRSVLLLWATKEHTYQEIAEILQVPIGTVMSRLHRARQHLAQALHDYARDNRLSTGEVSR